VGERVQVEAILATTRPIPGRGVALGENVIERIAEEVLAGVIPMAGHHDVRLKLDAEILAAEARRVPDGTVAAWVRLDVDSDAWAELGDVRGMSISALEPIVRADGPSDKPTVTISADAVHFDDESLGEARAILATEYAVSTGRLYQFADLPPAKVIVDLLAAALPILQGVAGSALWDGLKVFLTRRRPQSSIFNFVLHDDDKSVRAHLENERPRGTPSGNRKIDGPCRSC
jgi:hypothetical protein